MKNPEKTVISIIQSVVLNRYKSQVIPEAKLREDLGFDSIKMIAIAAQLKEEGIDVISGSANYDFATIETVQDVVNIVKDCLEEVKG